MKRIALFLFLISTPFLFMVLVNETSGPPTEKYRRDRCTRYCHSVGCLHTVEKYKDGSSPYGKSAEQVYNTAIAWLGNKETGMNYREMNLLVFVLGMPLLMSILLWELIRKDRWKK